MLNGRKYLGANSHTHKALLNYYNWHCMKLVKPARRYKMKLADDWCAMFVSVLAHEAGQDATDFPYEVSVFYMCEIARERGQFTDGASNVRVGDLLIYDWTGRGTFNHVGVVESVGADYLEVLEGNYSNSVGIRTVKRDSKSIRGIIALGSGVLMCENTRLEALVVRVLKGELGNGQDRRDTLGDDYEAVQSLINKML